MLDKRISKLSNILVNYSVSVQKGENVMIEAFGIDNSFIKELVKEVRKAGGYPFVYIRDNVITRELVDLGDEEYFKRFADIDGYAMEKMHCYIGIRGGGNAYEMSGIGKAQSKLYSNLYSYPVHHERRVNKTKWVVLRYPTSSMAQMAGVSTSEFEDFYFKVCTLDYSKMDKAMDVLADLMNRTDKVRIVAPNTDLTFSIKGVGSKKCSGHMNIPDGEVYTAPVKTSVNGTITYNTPSSSGGVRYYNVSLTFKNGKIVKATANGGDRSVEKVFDVDEGARYVGEFSFGLNPYITEPIGDILFDEKIAGSIHFTPGCAYNNCDNGNRSSLHWDLVLIMTEKFGGGDVYFDDVLIRHNGIFTLPELECLNPENLK